MPSPKNKPACLARYTEEGSLSEIGEGGESQRWLSNPDFPNIKSWLLKHTAFCLQGQELVLRIRHLWDPSGSIQVKVV